MDARGSDVVDRVGDHATAEDRLVEVADVVDDDVGVARPRSVGERADVVGEAELAGERGGEALRAPGAMSWTIWSIARPSSVPPSAGLLDDRRRPPSGRSPERMSSAAWTVSGSPPTVSVAASKVSDRAPTVMPRPSIPGHAVDAVGVTPCEVAAPTCARGRERLRDARDAGGFASPPCADGDEALDRVRAGGPR